MSLRIIMSLLILSCVAYLPAQEIEIDLKRNVGEAVLITVNRTGQGVVEATIGGEIQVKKLKAKTSLTAIDRLVSEAEGVQTLNRLYLSEQDTTDGVVADDGVDGLEVNYEIGADGESSCKYPQVRLIPRTRRKVEADRAAGLAGWLPLKTKMAVGDALELDLLPLMFDLTGESDLSGTAVGKFSLVAVDEAKGLAEFKGTIDAPLAPQHEEMAMKIHYQFDCDLTIDLQRQQISAIKLKGKGQVSGGNDDVSLGGSLQLESKWESEVGAAVTKASKKKTSFRDAVREFEGLPISAELPSHYGDVGASVGLGEGVTGYMSMLSGVESVRRIGVRVIPSNSGDSGQVVEQAIKVLKEQAPEAKFEKVVAKAGRGHSLSIEKDGGIVIQDYIAGKDKVIIVFYSAMVKDAKELLKEVKQVRKTLVDRSL